MLWIWLALTTIATIVYFGLTALGQALLYLAVAALAGLVLLLGPGRRSDVRLGWGMIGLGYLLSACGDALWGWYDVVIHVAPFPSLADVFYLAKYVPTAFGLLVLARAVGRRDAGALLDALVVAIGTGVLAWVTLITPYTSDKSLSAIVRIASIAFPAADLLLLTLLLRLLFTRPLRRHPALMFLGVSFGLVLASNAGFGWTSLQGTYASGHIIDGGWLLGFMLVGVAALHPSSRTVVPTEQSAPGPLLPRSRLVLLAVASMVAPVLVISAGTWDAEVDLTVVGAASGVLFLLVLWRMAGLVRQISVQAAELDALSTTDPLTGVANRRRWDIELQTAIARAHRSRQVLTVVLLDLDRFKVFNDTFGHLAGDALLKRATAAWQAELRPGDLLARIGGEEFAILLVGCEGDEAHAVVERLRAATPGDQTCSAGIAGLVPTDTHIDVVERADTALYHAKAAGRDRTAVASPAVAA